MIAAGELLQQVHAVKRLFEMYSDSVCKKLSLSQMGLSVLMFLNNNPDRDTAKDIVELRMLPKANVSKAVETLIQSGLLLRIQDKNDRRLIHLKLTAEAKKITPDIAAMQQAFTAQLFSGFEPEELALYEAMNARIAQNALEGINKG